MPDSYIVLIGWFVINDLMPIPTTFVFVNQLMAQATTKSGVEQNRLFARAILPKLSQFMVFTRSLLGIPGLAYIDPELFSIATQLSRRQLSPDSTIVKMHRVIPKCHGRFRTLLTASDFAGGQSQQLQ
jgi:hypothetical protein